MYKRQVGEVALKFDHLRSRQRDDALALCDSSVLRQKSGASVTYVPVSYTHLRAHETVLDLVCRLLLEKKKQTDNHTHQILHLSLTIYSSIQSYISQ